MTGRTQKGITAAEGLRREMGASPGLLADDDKKETHKLRVEKEEKSAVFI